MSYANNFDCEEDVAPRICDPCNDQLELGGIRHSAFYREDHVWTDPTDDAEWVAGIAAGTIIMVPKIKGSCNGGEPKVVPGYGDQKELVLGYDYTATIKDGAYKQNRAFWNSIRKSKRWKWAYFTDTLVHLTDQVVTVKPKSPVEESLDSIVEWNADIVWFQKDLIESHDATNLDVVLACV